MSDLVTAAEAAERLRLSTRKVYELAASGELASHRFGGAVRFALEDLEEYKHRCRSPATTRAAGSSSLTASSPELGNALTAYFRKAGRAIKPSPTTSGRPRGSSLAAAQRRRYPIESQGVFRVLP